MNQRPQNRRVGTYGPKFPEDGPRKSTRSPEPTDDPFPWIWFLVGVASVLVAASIAAWLLNNRIVIWLLSEGIADEAATRTLPGAINTVALVVGATSGVFIATRTVLRTPVAWMGNRLVMTAASTVTAIVQTATVVRAVLDIGYLLVGRVLATVRGDLSTAATYVGGRIAQFATLAGGIAFRSAKRVLMVIGVIILLIAVGIGAAIVVSWRWIAPYLNAASGFLVLAFARVVSSVATALRPPIRALAIAYAQIRRDVITGTSTIVAAIRQIARTVSALSMAVAGEANRTRLLVGARIHQIAFRIAQSGLVSALVITVTIRRVFRFIGWALVGISSATAIVWAFVWQRGVWTGGVVSAALRIVSESVRRTLGVTWQRATAAADATRRFTSAAIALAITSIIRTMRPPRRFVATAYTRSRNAMTAAMTAAVDTVRHGYTAVQLALAITARGVERATHLALKAATNSLSQTYRPIARFVTVAARGVAQWIARAWSIAVLLVVTAASAIGIAVTATANTIAMGIGSAWNLVVRVAARSFSVIWAAVLIAEQAFWLWIGRATVAVGRSINWSLGVTWAAASAAASLVGSFIAGIARPIGSALATAWTSAAAFASTVGAAIWMSISVATVYSWRGISAATAAVKDAATSAAHFIYRPVAIVTVAVVTAWLAVFVALGRGLASAIGVVGTTAHWVGAAVATSVSWGLGVSHRVLAQAFAAISRVLAIVARDLKVAGEVATRWLGRAVVAIVAVSTSTMATVWQPIATVITVLAHGLVQVTSLASRMIAISAERIAADLGTAGSAVGRSAVFVGQRISPIFAVASAALANGANRVVNDGVVLFRALWWPIRVTFWGSVHSPVFIANNIGIGFGVIPDLMEGATRLTGGSGARSTESLNLGPRRLTPFAAVFTVLAVGIVVCWRIVTPWPPWSEELVVVDHWATGHLFFDEGLEEMATRFNSVRHRSESGLRIEVKVHNNPSSLQTEDLLSRLRDGKSLPRECCGPGPDPHRDPTIITPSSPHWIVPMNDALIEAGKAELTIDLASAASTRPIALAYIGIVTHQAMAECLGWPQKAIGFSDIIELRSDPRGWKSCPTASAEWGTRPLVAFTDPKESSTGRSVLLGLYSIASEIPPDELTLENIEDEAITGYVKEFAGLIDHYMIGTTQLNTKIHQGPRFGHFFLMPEDNLIHLKEGTVGAFFGGVRSTAPPYLEPMVMIYPKEETMARNNCACLVNAPWVDEEEAAAADLWIDYLQEERQQRAFMRAGFRPVTGISLSPNDTDNRITAKFGLSPETPSRILDVSKINPGVAAAIDGSWEDVKRPGAVTFVVDTSGSMLVGSKLDRAKDGIRGALSNMATGNQVGIVTFDDVVRGGSPVRLINDAVHREELEDAVNKMKGRGETALYDAIRQGIEMTDSARASEDAIRAVVVLTDGQANRGTTGLDDLVSMVSKSGEVTIKSFSGYVDGRPPMDERDRLVAKMDVTGTDLKLDTAHDIQIFFIGIGDDADLDIGRILAEATGAEFQGVTEEDLAAVLEEFSGYF